LKAMPTLYFGGSFNPVHRAHLACSLAAAKAGGFERVVLVPSHQPVLKSKSYDLAPAEHRVAMLMLACESMKGTSVAYDLDLLELDRAGPTYTIDTALALGATAGDPIDWLVGADQVLNLHRWHRYDELLSLVRFWVMQRPGYPIDWAAVDSKARPLKDHVVEIPPMDISATQIRDRVRGGASIAGLVPERVREYIERHRLFIP
jgi:nicotinate-nucleotide adenylyltransferase